MITQSHVLVKARQQELARDAKQRVWQTELRIYRRRSGALQIVRLRRP